MAFRSGVKGGLKKAALAVSSILIQSVNVIKETVNRSLSLPDLVGHALGLVPTKKLRLRVVILRDESSLPLTNPVEVMPSIEAAQVIFERQTRTKIITPCDRLIETLGVAAPTEALDVHCDFEAWKEGLKEAGNFFETYLEQNAAGMLTGYAAPITVFIVRNVSGKAGCSLGPLTDYVTVALCGLAVHRRDDKGCTLPRILAHEVGHACGLWHVKDASNLMSPGGSGINLRWWQKAILRSSRHVTYF